MGCLGSCLGCINKTLLYILNLVLFLFGLAVVVIASIALSKTSEFGDLLTEGTFTLPIIVLIVGIFILLLGFFGCCGAKKENSCMLYTYSTVLLCLVIAQVTCGILLLVYKDSAEDFIKEGMDEAFDKYNNPKDDHFTDALDNIQQELKCCGTVGPDIYQNGTYMSNDDVADGCCIDMKTGCGSGYFDHGNPADIYQDGCYDVIKDELLGLGLGISGLVLAAAGVQLVIVILACCLAKKGKGKENV